MVHQGDLQLTPLIVIQVQGTRLNEDTTWRFGPGHIELQDLYLVELRQVSQASFQPVLAIRRDAAAKQGSPSLL